MRAVDLLNVRIEARGFEGDRRWMAVDPAGRFLTQRSHPKLAKINARPTPGGIELSAEGAGAVDIARPGGEERRKVVVWDTEVEAAVAGAAAGDFLSALLGEKTHLVYMDEKALRLKESVWTAAPVPVSFADAYPILVTTTGSLAELNREIEAHGGDAAPMARFRPNLVLDCDEPWAEDRWAQLRIGETVLDLVKPCDRCIVTTTDQQTGARMGKEPIQTLLRIHRSTDPRIKGVIFGENAVPRTLGRIAVGDTVEILEMKPAS